MKPVFIKGASAISPQKTFLSKGLPDDIVVSDNNLLRCIEPSYSNYLNPVMARRMGRIIKMGIASAMECLKDAKIEMPGAIVTGTALGCLGDTEKFLTSIIQDNEQFLTPTNFIQSIQNTVSAQIALQLKCMNHNFTFVHKGFSFESALMDAVMLLEESDADNILTGGLDEMTEKNFHIYNRLGIWKKRFIRSTDLFNDSTPGTIGGEGSTFFVLSKYPGDNDYAALKAVKLIYDPSSPAVVENHISKILNEVQLDVKDISLVLYGSNGDLSNDEIYNHLKNGILKNSCSGYFKHLCGEYQTSGAFAMWLASVILESQQIPDALLPVNKKQGGLSNILLHNSYGNNHSLLLFSALK